MKKLRLMFLAFPCFGLVSCGSAPTKPSQAGISSAVARKVNTLRGVKTTAYTETESDHLVYGAKAATGSRLRYGNVRSAAADWSVYPVGTMFKIEGDSHVYEVDDYGSALVGTETIDLYKPSKAAMNDYGARRVNIHVLKWGSESESLAIIKPREDTKPHVRQMVTQLERSTQVRNSRGS